jgi:hypothetical protein
LFLDGVAGVEEAAGFLHRQGLLMHYDEAELRDWVIVDPLWLPKLMASVVSYKTAVGRSDGIMRNDDLARDAWAHYSKELQRFLFALVRRFGVMIALDDQTSLVPALLTDSNANANANANGEYVVHRRYSLNFMPRDLFARLLVALLRFHDWKTCTWHANAFAHHGIIESRITVHVRDVDVIVWGEQASAMSSFQLMHAQVISTAQFWSGINITQRVVLRDGRVMDAAQLDVSTAFPELGTFVEPHRVSSLQRIGEGGAGTIWRGVLDGSAVALKSFAKNAAHMNERERQQEFDARLIELSREIAMMSRLQHRNVIALLGFTVHEQWPAMIIELAPHGSLYSMLRSDVELSLALRIRIAYDIASALDYLHSQRPRVVHRDLKSPNVLIVSMHAHDDMRPIAKLADFGATVHVAHTVQGRAIDNLVMLAPEIMHGLEYNHLSDVYSFALLMWELWTRRTPYDSLSERCKFAFEFEEAIKRGTRPSLEGIDAKLAELCEACWASDPNMRPNIRFAKPRLAQLGEFADLAEDAVAHDLIASSIRTNAEDVLRSLYAEGVTMERAEIEAVQRAIDGKAAAMQLVTLAKNSVHYNHVVTGFMNEAVQGGKELGVVSVELIVNATQTLRYWQFLQSRSAEMQREAMLYHYANPEVIGLIASHGFNSSYCGAGWFGWGIYFSPDPMYALIDYGYKVSIAHDDNGDVVAEFWIRNKKNASTGRRPALKLYNYARPEKLTLDSNSKLRAQGHSVMIGNVAIVQHTRPCFVKKHYVAMVCSVVVGEKKKIVLRKDLEDRPCKAQFCGGPQDHMVHWSQDLNEVCVPLRHGLLGVNDISTDWQILPRYVIKFAKPNRIKQRK